MQTDTVLTDIATFAASLVAQKTLRSKAVLLQRLMPLIDEAMRLGHRHEAIHRAIEGAGVELTFGYYRNTLHRLRTRNSSGSSVSNTHGIEQTLSRVGSAEPKEVGSQEPKQVGVHETESVGSQEPKQQQEPGSSIEPGDAFAVRDALKKAQAASRIDYRKHAKGKS